ncbi:MAG: alpha-1,2-fucosyltransferase [Deltaproteobacteria bacterium]|nr:alpha-1,2-fucosyltransferase [Deltaproteobacteria bacterium]
MIVVKLQGGLGNQMFQYALGRELQRRNENELCLDLTWLLDRYPRSGVVFRNYELDIFAVRPRLTLLSHVARRFSLPLVLMYGSQALREVKTKVGLMQYLAEAEMQSPLDVLEARGKLYLDGYWQSPKYFEGSEAILRREFKVRRPLSPAAEQIATRMAATDSICVNVRRTDYVTLPASIEMHGFVGKEYYDRGIALITSQLRNPHVFVTSDDIEWCRDNLRFDCPTTVLGHEYKGDRIGQDLALMSCCKHFVIANSSFGWWSAWLSPNPEKIVVCPKDWFRKPLVGNPDMILPGWIRL